MLHPLLTRPLKLVLVENGGQKLSRNPKLLAMAISNGLILVVLLVVVLLHSDVITCSVSVSYLRRITRTDPDDVFLIDHYFCCNVEGPTLQWSVNEESFFGYGVQDVGRVTTTLTSSYNTSSSLLSVDSMQDVENEGFLDSVLIVSVHRDILLNISCSNSREISSSNNRVEPEYLAHTESISFPVYADYVVAAPIVKRSSYLTHIFLCATSEPQLGLSVGDIFVGFNSGDSVGRYKTAITNNTANVVAVLGHRRPSISFAIVTRGGNFTLRCVDENNYVQLSSRDEFTKVRLNTTNATTDMEEPPLFIEDPTRMMNIVSAAKMGPASQPYTIGCIIIMIMIAMGF